MENNSVGANTGSFGPVGMSASKPKKHSKLVHRGPYVAAIVVLAVLMLGGVGFGAFGMITKGQVDDKVGLLNDELEQKDEALKLAEEKLGAKIEVDPVEDVKDETTSVSNTNVSAAKDYIYVGEWGIKIKVSDKLAAVSYVFNGTINSLYVTGALKDRGQYVPSFVSNRVDRGTGLGALARHHKDDAVGTVKVGELAQTSDGYTLGEVLYVDGDWFYTYQHTQAPYGTESEQQWEIDSAEEVREMLKSGISAF